MKLLTQQECKQNCFEEGNSLNGHSESVTGSFRLLRFFSFVQSAASLDDLPHNLDSPIDISTGKPAKAQI